MLWHITKREIYDHFTSLRFALTVGLVTLLMVLNALFFIGSDYEQKMREYSENINWVTEKIKKSCKHLNELAEQGPVAFYKRPSPLSFCANDQEDALPMRIQAETLGRSSWGPVLGGPPEHSYSYRFPWFLRYRQDNYQQNSMLQTFTALDWSFIIGVVMSFVAILFTFDAISGERERGTLALTLSYAVPRGVILFSKFLGAFIAIAIPMLMGMLLSLLIVNLSGVVSLDGNDWVKIGLMTVLSFIYISLFIGLGLVISSRMERSSTSLLILLLLWVVVVVLVPNTFGTVVSTLRKAPTPFELKQRADAMRQANRRSRDELFKYGSPSQAKNDIRAIRLWADYITTRWKTETQLMDEILDTQFVQVQFARKILRVSPTTIYNYAMEDLAGTGFGRHKRFVEAVQRYRSRFIDFIKATDRTDPDSYHVYYLKEGLSDKPVNFEDVPRFEEPTGVDVAFRGALTDLSLLVLFSALLFFASYAAFLRCDIR